MQTQKEQETNTNETQIQRAFWISISTGVVMLVILATFLITDSSRALVSLKDVRVFVGALALSGFISAWLARRDRVVLGISLILVVFYTSIVLTVLSIADIGTAMGVVMITFTFGLTSTVIPTARLSKYANTLAFILAIGIILMDLIRPFERAANNTPEITWGLTGLLIMVYGALVLRQFGSYSLRVKLIIAFLIVTIIPLATLAFLNDRNTRTALTNDANQALLSSASETAAELDNFMKEHTNAARAEAQFAAVIDYILLPASQRAGTIEETRLVKFIYARLTQDPVYITSVAIYDINGVTLADTYTSDVGTNKSSRSWFQQAVATGLPYASDVEFSQTTGEASIYFSAPVRDVTGKIIGVIRTRYNAAVLQSMIISSRNLAGQGSFAVLVDKHRNVRLAHGTTPSLIFKTIIPKDPTTIKDLQARRLLPPGSPEELSTNLPDFEAGLNNAENQPFFTSELQATGHELEQIAVINTQTQEWRVVYAVSQETFLAPIRTQARANIVLTLVMALIVAGVALFVSQTLAAPLVRLTQVAETIAGGDINIQAKVETADEIGVLASTFNRMTQQLRDFIANLEERVAARTKDLATVAEVGTATSTILETDKLLLEIANLTKERFNLYHSHIYLLDEKGANLELAAGAGEAGRQMKAKGLSIPLSREQSLVARAARERKGVTVNDVTKAPDFLPNPLLPDTRSELAVPMLVGETLIGVFDIQSNVAGRFTDSDINIQTTLAAQLASSVQNARSYERSKAQADFETLVNAISQKIQRAGTVEDTLQTAIRELGMALGASRVQANIQARHDVSDNKN